EIEADFEPDGGELVPLDLEEVPPPTWPSPEPAPVAYHGIMAGFEDMAAPEERQDWPVANMGGEGLVPLVPHPHGPDEAEDAPSDLQGDAPLVYGSKAQAVEVASEVPTSEDAMPLGKASFVHVASSAPPLGEQPAEGTSARPTIFRHDAALHEYGMVGASAQEEEDAADDLFDPLTGSDLDLSALRDIVAEMIRDELRGTLGERITRNLRTLVRREIARALAEEGPKGN
ncbi:MAG: hypothetical protein ORN49_12785, partial [Rhodobacteraceae bacterium]|nr:hypothetical protein [Paracoccaceae bacterium]